MFIAGAQQPNACHRGGTRRLRRWFGSRSPAVLMASRGGSWLATTRSASTASGPDGARRAAAPSATPDTARLRLAAVTRAERTHTGSPADLGYVLGAETAAQVVFLLAGGVIADRLCRRAVMLGADCVRGAAEAALGALLITGHPSVWLIAALAAVAGMGGALFTPASTGLTPAVVSSANLRQANQIQQVAGSGAWVAGPALAGVLVVAASPGWAARP